MRILTDFHHSSLYSSLLYTLESRLGHSVYRQIGERWFKEGFWKINRQADTIQQYLGTYGYQPIDGTPSLNNVMWVQDGIYYSRDPNTAQIHKAITFETFMGMNFDVIIASIPQHIEPFMDLARRKGARFIFQVGNEFPFDYNTVPNLMASIMPRPLNCHHVFYHQEFDQNVFRYREPVQSKEIHNYMNVLHNYPEGLEMFTALEKEMPDYSFKMFGSQNRDGCVSGNQQLADSMAKARWIFHCKPGGDGYGHVVYNTFSVGRPLIVKKQHYEGKLAGRMMRDKESCLVIDGMSPKQMAEYIRSHEEKNEQMSKSARQVFEEYVNWEKESKDIQKFLEELV
jgi:hypothetical protein